MRIIDRAYAGAVGELRANVSRLHAFVEQLPVPVGEPGGKVSELQDWELVAAVNQVAYYLAEAVVAADQKLPEIEELANRYDWS